MPIVSEREIDTFQRDGVIVLRQVFEQRWLEQLAAGSESCRLNPSSRSNIYVNDVQSDQRFFFDARTIGEIEEYDRVILNSPMAEAAGRLMESTCAIPFYVTIFQRSPGTQSRTPWHQDQPSWSAEGDQGCSIWASLDSVPVETALEFVRGSHQWKTRYSRAQFFQTEYEDDKQSGLQPFPDIEGHRNDYDIAAWALEPGDCVVFHGMTAHGGSGNLPENLGRRAISVQWLGDDARHRLVPGGDDPNISVEVAKYGVKPGDSLVCEICPIAWRAEY